MTSPSVEYIIVEALPDSDASSPLPRLDLFLTSHYPKYSRTYLQRLIAEGLVLLNGEVTKKRIPIQLGDEIEIAFPIEASSELLPEAIPLKIIYEDPYLLIIDKEAGMVVHPGAGNPSGTVVNALLYYCAHQAPLDVTQYPDPLRPGIVHRLDRYTSGLLILAKTQLAHQKMVDAFAQRLVKKCYLAIVAGGINLPTEVQGKIARHPAHREKMILLPNDSSTGKSSLTTFKVLSQNREFSLVAAYPHTGRTHQIRVHLASAHAPILGDEIYATEWAKGKMPRQMLHAYKLEFPHPITDQTLSICAPPPADFLQALIKTQLGTGSLTEPKL